MNKRNFYLHIVFGLCLIILFTGCMVNKEKVELKEGEEYIIKDALGREVVINKTSDRIVAVGPGALRLCCYIDIANKIVGVEQFEKDNPIGRPYFIVNADLIKSLPAIGFGGPNNVPEHERIISTRPDVIFTTYATDKAQVDNLQKKIGIPVVAISYGKIATFDKRVYESLRLIGEVVGKEKRAEDVVNYIEKYLLDLETRTSEIKEDSKPTTYVGALGMRGAHGIESTQGNYALLNVVNGVNVVDETNKTGSVMVDKEKLLEWNPDKIFIDYGGLNIVMQDYNKNSEYYKALSAFKNEEVYSQLPYNYYSTNLDTAIVDAYYIGKTLYPEEFNDIRIEEKADEIYKSLLGKSVYNEMIKNHGGLKKLKFENK
jgi:iron complex transport system substrate-binding protein